MRKRKNPILWEKWEDEKLISLLAEGKKCWNDIAIHIGRTAESCRNRATRLKLEYIYVGTRNNKKYIKEDSMPGRATGELLHANGDEVAYEDQQGLRPVLEAWQGVWA